MPRPRARRAEIELRPLADSGLRVSRVGLGCNNFGGRVDLDGTRAVVEAALEAGINHFDTADVYGRFGSLPGAGAGRSEELLGAVLDGRRDEVVLATKFGVDMRDGYDGPRGGRDYIQRAIAGSLERLRTDHVDIYYYHLPDGVTPIEETLEALHELVEDGRVRAIGCSNFAPAQLREADAVARAAGISRFVGLQNEYSLLKRAVEAELLPLCRELGVAFVPYFPLASGLLTGKYRRGEPPPAETRLSARPEALSDEALARVDALEAFARERGRSVLELAIAALASRPGVVSVIAGATRPDQVRANAAAADWTLDADDLDALERVAA